MEEMRRGRISVWSKNPALGDIRIGGLRVETRKPQDLRKGLGAGWDMPGGLNRYLVIIPANRDECSGRWGGGGGSVTKRHQLKKYISTGRPSKKNQPIIEIKIGGVGLSTCIQFPIM